MVEGSFEEAIQGVDCVSHAAAPILEGVFWLQVLRKNIKEVQALGYCWQSAYMLELLL
ncbi:hypothetical protein SOVF_166480 [Spinacia oleracea]|nr:hypothetical protein SOVF_166480 [Spinacia oleracea]